MPRIGHELLTIIFRYAQILVSTLDPGALVAKPQRLHLSILDESKVVCSLHWLPQKRPVKGLFMEPMPRIELGTYAFAYTSVSKK